MFLDIIHRPVYIKTQSFGDWIMSYLTHRPVYIKTQRFGDWILSQSSGKTYSVGPNG
jgi:hypothetical protein